MTGRAMIRLCDVTSLEPGAIRAAVLPSGHTLAIHNVDGRFYITDDTCTHGHASLSEEGTLSGTIVECGWHFGAFDVTTGEAKAMPCSEPLRTYPAHVIDGGVWIDQPALASASESTGHGGEQRT